MSDLLTQLRGYGEQLEAQMAVLEPEDVRLARVGTGAVRALVDREPPPRRRWLVPAIGLAAVVAVVLAVLFWPRSGDPAPFINEGTTTEAPGSTVGTLAPIPAGAVAAGSLRIVADSVSAEEALSLSSRGNPLVAVSNREAWTFGADDGKGGSRAGLIGRLEDGVWAYWRVSGPDWWLRSRPEGWWVRALAAGPDGTVWAATDAGLFSFDGQQWTRRRLGPTAGVTVDGEGTAWILGWDGLWVSRWDGEGRAELAYWGGIGIPCGGTAMAALPGGEVWTSGGCWVGDVHLYRYDGTSVEPVVIEGFEEPALYVIDLEAAPNGDLWLWGTPSGWPNMGSQVVLARFHGDSWTVYEWPFELPSPQWDGGSPFGGLAVAADGVVWLASGDGLRTFDGTEWTQRLQGQPIYTVDVAPDGTVWYSDGDGLHRLDS